MKIIFVYNADSDLFSTAKDFVKKIVVPNKYQCNLCKITFGPLNMKEEWKQFIEHLDKKVEFMHKDEFVEKYAKDLPFPAAFMEDEGKVKLIISAEEINKCKNLKELKELVEKRI